MLVVASILPCLALRLGIPGRLSRMESSLLAQATAGEGAAQLLSQFERLEKAAPPPLDLLERSESGLEGRWQLVATIAGSRVGASAEELSSSGVSGVVNASGISVRAEDAVQQINLRSGRISNEVPVQPFGVDLLVRVVGALSQRQRRPSGEHLWSSTTLRSLLPRDSAAVSWKAVCPRPCATTVPLQWRCR